MSSFSQFMCGDVSSTLSPLNNQYLADWLLLIRLQVQHLNTFSSPEPTASQSEHRKTHSDKRRIKSIAKNIAG